MTKHIIFGIVAVVIVIIGVVYRDSITMILGGGSVQLYTSPMPSPSGTAISRVSETPPVFPSVTPVPSSKPAVYQGRPADELRPVPEEVKLFSESQKQEIYRSLQNYGKSVIEHPDFFDGWIQLGLLKKNIGDFEGARDAWEFAGVIRPLNSISFSNLGELYWRYLKLPFRAETNFRISIKNDAKNVGAYITLSQVYFYSIKEKIALADDVLLEGMKANPQSMDLVRALARLYEQTGEYTKSIEWWQKVLAKNPNDTSITAVINSLKKKLAQ